MTGGWALSGPDGRELEVGGKDKEAGKGVCLRL